MKQLLPLLLIVFCYACSTPSSTSIPITIIKGKIELPPIRTAENVRNNSGYLQSLAERQVIKLVSNAIRNGIEVPNQKAKIDKEGNYEFKLRIGKHPLNPIF